MIMTPDAAGTIAKRELEIHRGMELGKHLIPTGASKLELDVHMAMEKGSYYLPSPILPARKAYDIRKEYNPFGV